MTFSQLNSGTTQASTTSVSSMLYGRLEVDAKLHVKQVLDKSVMSLLGVRQIEGLYLAALLKQRVSLEDYDKIQPFLKSLVHKRDLLDSSSHQTPFDCLKVALPSENGRAIRKYLRFEFLKSKTFTDNGHWVVVIRDISKSVRLSRQIRRSTQRVQLKVNTMMSLLQFERELIKDFLLSTADSLRNILKNLDVSAANQHQLRTRIENIYCIVHQIKGDAAILNMTAISHKAHAFEGLLSKLNDRREITLPNIYALRRPVKSIIDSVKDIHQLFEKIVEGGWNNRSEGGGDSMKRRLSYLVKRIADSQNKRILIVDDGYLDSAVPLHLRRDLSSMVTQLARNAIVHGIELPLVREQAFKTPYGCLHISVAHVKQRLVVKIRDDGAGVNCEKVRQVAMKSPYFIKHRVEAWTKSQLMQVLFHPGFSTSQTVDQHSGRGIGLDYIKNCVEKHGGSINLRSIQGQFTEFTLSFPLSP